MWKGDGQGLSVGPDYRRTEGSGINKAERLKQASFMEPLAVV